MSKRNFLLGKGERLTEDIVVRSGGAPKAAPYTFAEARARLVPKLVSAVKAIEALPDDACPQDQAVVALTLNPEYIAKSYFPHDLLKAAGITSVGSRPLRMTPEKRSRDRAPESAITTELFVMGPRDSFRYLSDQLPNLIEGTPVAKDLITLEDITAPSVSAKIKGPLPAKGTRAFEIVLHTDQLLGENYLIAEFRKYIQKLGIQTSFDRRFYAGGLCFLELDAPAELAANIATFSVVRALREMPRLRMLRPTIRSSGVPAQALQLPTVGPLDTKTKVAVFDGGLPANHALTQWATAIDAPGVGISHPVFLTHGVGVTSALLFGHIDPNAPVPRPYTNVDHYRVLDTAPGQNPHELYEVLDRIARVLASKKYDFVNLSLGPQLPIEDDDVHAWTAVLDDRLSRSETLASVAVGNDGEGDAALGLNRIQVPSDCVNALAVGACDTPEDDWRRAPYSSVGPGRSPGLMKPDLVEFGGSVARPFLVVSDGPTPMLDGTGGTSFASPAVLRLGTGVRAHFGDNLSLLAIRSLLIHSTEDSDHPREEVGWGRIARSLDEIVLTEDDTIRVVYQGTVTAKKYIRAPIPVPSVELTGNVNITATLCYKSLTDPHHPGNYTRAGLEVTFRPHDQKFSRGEDQIHPDTKAFFGAATAGLMEDERRRDAWKWENCLHAVRRFRGTSLRNPCFDIHYNARLEGRDFAPDTPLPYALVVTVQSKQIADLYDQVVRKYATQLEPLRPTIDIPVRT